MATAATPLVEIEDLGQLKRFFCFQCEQTMKGTGCSIVGTCSKDAKLSTLMDLLLYTIKGLAVYVNRLNQETKSAHLSEVASHTAEAMFSTLTHVNFDHSRMVAYINKTAEWKAKLKELYEAECIKTGVTPLDGATEGTLTAASFVPAGPEMLDLINQGLKVGYRPRVQELNTEIVNLQEFLMYGLKGVCAYAHHAEMLGYTDASVWNFLFDALDKLTQSERVTEEELLNYLIECGKINVTVLAMLDQAHNDKYGHPEPTQVKITPTAGKCILVSGHDIHDLEHILQQTEGKGINVYTHGELLPANAYPGVKKYKHLMGNIGGAWHQQKKDFEAFPGAIVMTTNCLMKPLPSYKDRIFTTGPTGYTDMQHVTNNDYSKVVECALACDGYSTTEEPAKTITIGFARDAVLSVADTVVNAVKSGAIRHFFVIGGCDSPTQGRDYYTHLAEAIPRDCVILTAGCTKYRFNKLDLGDIGGIPRVLDAGQCNDSFSIVQIGMALAKEFQVGGINELPISLVISWFEQKAVADLLSLLFLGLKRIRLGPRLPAFVTPKVLNILVEKFDLKLISSTSEDLENMLKCN